MSEPVILALIAGLPAFVVSLGTLAGIIITAFRVKKVHTEINSRMSQLLEITAISSKAEGVKEELERSK